MEEQLQQELYKFLKDRVLNSGSKSIKHVSHSGRKNTYLLFTKRNAIEILVVPHSSCVFRESTREVGILDIFTKKHYPRPLADQIYTVPPEMLTHTVGDDISIVEFRMNHDSITYILTFTLRNEENPQLLEYKIDAQDEKYYFDFKNKSWFRQNFLEQIDTTDIISAVEKFAMSSPSGNFTKDSFLSMW